MRERMRVRYRYSTVDWEEPVLGWLSILRRGRRRRQRERRFCTWGSQVNFLSKVKPRNVDVSLKGRVHEFRVREGDFLKKKLS